MIEYKEPLTPFQDSVSETPETFDLPLETIGQRIKILRKAAKLTQSALADIVGITQTRLVRYEKDQNTPSPEVISDLADALGSTSNWIGFGEGHRDGGVPILGFVGAGAAIYPIDDHEKGAADEYVRPPFDTPSDAIAVTVKGDSMYPEMDGGDILIYRRDAAFVLQDCLNKRCVIHLDDGRVVVKRLKFGRKDGAFDLVSVNAPTMENVRILWAAPILGVVYP